MRPKHGSVSETYAIQETLTAADSYEMLWLCDLGLLAESLVILE